MMTIYFKNGSTKKVSIEIAEILKEILIAGCGNFQCFSDTNGKVFLIVNISEIVYIS